MPTYEYECTQCGHQFEHFQSMKDAPLTDCPAESCGAKGTVRRLIGSGGGVIFKGSGFYVTDYKKNGCAAAGSSSSSKESKSESAPCACPNAGSCPMAEKKD